MNDCHDRQFVRHAWASRRVTEREWQKMLHVFRAVLTEFEVPQKQQNELVAIVESTKAEIVVN